MGLGSDCSARSFHALLLLACYADSKFEHLVEAAVLPAPQAPSP